jgi:hypothetical protein
LMLANAVAACYLSGRSGAHPTRMELVKFVENAKFSGQVLR